jgi:membrane protein
LLADPSTIRSHLETLSGLLPGGALSVIGDQITRVSAQGKTTLGFTFLAAFGISLWSANAGTKALFDALNIVSLGFTLIGIVLLLIVLAAMVVLHTVLAYLGIASKTEWLLKVARWPLLVLLVSFGVSIIYRHGAEPGPRTMAMAHLGKRLRGCRLAFYVALVFLVC